VRTARVVSSGFLNKLAGAVVVRLLIEVWESLRIAVRAIRAQKMRAMLTTLGIVIGIVSVTAMATVVNGLENKFDEDMASLGTDVLYVEKWPWGFVRDWWNYINRPNITADLADVVEDRSRFAAATVPLVDTRRSVVFEGNTIAGAEIVGATDRFPLVHVVELGRGRFYSEVDERAARPVCVIGAEIAEALFPVQDPVGKQVRVGGNPFQVIGILERKGQGAEGPGSVDNRVMMPYSSFARAFGVRWRSASVQIRVVEGVALTDAKDEIEGLLRVARGLDAREDSNFEINEAEGLRAQIEPIKNAIYSIGIGLTALALLVGGIGVMNIMFVSVKERTKEIGIRKAVGAPRRAVLTQFLIEAMIVCLVGGLVGVAIAFPLTFAVQMILPATMDLQMAGWAFLICVMVGTVFGLAPAWTAARSEPIEALHYE
jgi:putative ABC transport system permease protein